MAGAPGRWTVRTDEVGCQDGPWVPTYTHPDVLTIGVRDGWADPITDPTEIDWAPRQAAAAIPFEVIDGRPVNPCEQTKVRYGRNELGHWGEAVAADALVSVVRKRTGLARIWALLKEALVSLGVPSKTKAGSDGTDRWIVMVERSDGHGWALPGGFVEPGEQPMDAAVRELGEETCLRLPNAVWRSTPPRYVPDPRASDEAWMVTVLCTADLGRMAFFPEVTGADDAARAAWVRANSYEDLVTYLEINFQGTVFPAHVDMLAQSL